MDRQRRRRRAQAVRTARTALLVCLSAFLFGATGCAVLLVGAGAGVGVAAATYVAGDLEATVNAGPWEVADAAKQAFADLKIQKTSVRSSSLDAKIVGRTGQDKTVTIKAERDGTNHSRVSIRVGVFGDEPKSRVIYEAMRKYLP